MASVAAGAGALSVSPATAKGAGKPRRRPTQRPQPSALDAGERSRSYLPGLTSLDVGEEIEIDSLPVEGAIPSWLSGVLVRNGPAKWEVGRRTFTHWFDGLGMLHGFAFQRGRVSYRNRFLRSSQYESAVKDGTIAYTEFGTDPCRSIYSGAVSTYQVGAVPNANVTVKQLGDRFVANTETPLPVIFDPKTLETLGVHTASASDAQLTTAHPHVDPRSGEVVDYQIRVEPNTAYIVRSFKNGAWRKLVEVPTTKFAYLHSFALTPRYAVIAECPFTVDPTSLLLDRRPFIENYSWDTSRGTRFIVIERSSGDHIATLEDEPFFCFHQINAYEDGGRIVVDLIAHANAEIVEALCIARLRGDTARTAWPDFSARRAVLNPAGGTVAVQRLGDGFELPRINYSRHNTLPYRYAWGVNIRDRATSGFLDQIVKLDTRTGLSHSWHEPGCHPGEPVFVPSPRARREDDGVLLSVVLDGTHQTSFLLVLDAGSLKEIGRALVPQHIPFGFHGELFQVS